MKQTTITLNAPAKINFTLDVLSRRTDGYHELSTIMQSVALADTVTVTLAPAAETEIRITCDVPFIPTDARNVAYQAAARFLEAVGQTASVQIDIVKRIPVGAGMGGGSTDAAAVLRALNAAAPTPLTPMALNALAASVGADVPFALIGGCAWAKGIGEALQPLPTVEKLSLVICKPRASASTRQIFQRLQLSAVTEHPDTDGAVAAIRAQNAKALAFRLFNVLEPVTAELCPVVSDYHRRLLQSGALGAVMTGSGTAVFGIFATEDGAIEAALQLQEFCDDVCVTETVGENPSLSQ